MNIKLLKCSKKKAVIHRNCMYTDMSVRSIIRLFRDLNDVSKTDRT